MTESRKYSASASRVKSLAVIDQGLRSYMLGVYNLMGLGLLITGLVAYSVYSAAVSNGQLTDFGNLIYTSPLRWVIFLSPIALVFFLGYKISSLDLSSAKMLFCTYAALVGLSLSSIFLVYTGESITQTFFVCASSFGALSLYGYTTQRDLTSMGSFMVMGVFGLLFAMLVNIFLQSSALQFAIAGMGVLAFSGLTAYDTQRIKEIYWEGDDALVTGRKSILGALMLYLDFLNLFTFLLHFLGRRD